MGVLIDDELNWSSHVDKVIKIFQRNTSVIRRARTYFPQNSLELLCNSLVLPLWIIARLYGQIDINLKQPNLSIPKFQTDCYEYSPIVSSIHAWNRLDMQLDKRSQFYRVKLVSHDIELSIM